MTIEKNASPSASGAPLSAEAFDPALKPLLHRGLVLHFMVQLSITEDADTLLAERKMGRVHHRILYFAHFTPGITIGELLDVLGVSHQNIQQKLRRLVQEQYVVTRPSPKDGRVKQLYCSPKGEKLLEYISQGQRERIGRAYKAVTPRDLESYFKVMAALLDPDRREWADRLTMRQDDPTDSI